MRVNEYETVPLRRNNFEFVDESSPPVDVVIDIRTEPRDVATDQPMGRLLHADTREPLQQFTQKMVNHLKELGSKTLHIPLLYLNLRLDLWFLLLSQSMLS